jgi:hypothetical protein
MKTGFGLLLLAFSSLAYSVNRMIDASDLPSGGSGNTAMVLAMIHALPMLVVAAWTRSKLITVLTGIGMVGVAIAIGGARYAVFDLFFVALGTWGAFRFCVPKGLSAKDRPTVENASREPTLADFRAMAAKETKEAKAAAKKANRVNKPAKRLSEFAKLSLAADAAMKAEYPKRIETAKAILGDVAPMGDKEMKDYFDAMSDNKCNSFIYSFGIPGWLDPDSVVAKTAAKGSVWWASVDYPTQSEAAWAILTMIRHATGHAHAEMSEEDLLNFIGEFIRSWRQRDREDAAWAASLGRLK